MGNLPQMTSNPSRPVREVCQWKTSSQCFICISTRNIPRCIFLSLSLRDSLCWSRLSYTDMCQGIETPQGILEKMLLRGATEVERSIQQERMRNIRGASTWITYVNTDDCSSTFLRKWPPTTIWSEATRERTLDCLLCILLGVSVLCEFLHISTSA